MADPKPWRPTVLAIVLDPGGRVLLGLRGPRARAGAGDWTPPGGGLEPEDATPEAGAARETREEAGLELLRARTVGYSHGYSAGSGRAYLSAHVVGFAEGEPELREPETFERWAWFEPEDLPERTWSREEVRSAARAVYIPRDHDPENRRLRELEAL